MISKVGAGFLHALQLSGFIIPSDAINFLRLGEGIPIDRFEHYRVAKHFCIASGEKWLPSTPGLLHRTRFPGSASMAVRRGFSSRVSGSRTNDRPTPFRLSRETLQSAGVIWSKGEVTILDGEYRFNEADGGNGAVWFASEGGTFNVNGGVFERNNADGGGVGYVNGGSVASVTGGYYTGNSADNGGVFSAKEDSNFEVRHPSTNRALRPHVHAGPAARNTPRPEGAHVCPRRGWSQSSRVGSPRDDHPASLPGWPLLVGEAFAARSRL